MSTAHYDLSSFGETARAGGAVPVPGVVQKWQRKAVILLVISLAAGAIGAALLSLGLQPWNRLTLLLVAIGAGAVPTYLLMARQIRPSDASRISRFAASNGFTFDYLKESPGYQGSNFTRLPAFRRLKVVKGMFSGHPVEFGNMWFRPGHRRNPYAVPGYVAIRLPARLPHMIMTSRRTLRMQVMWHPDAGDEVKVPVGGAFRMYAPAGAAPVASSLVTTNSREVFARLTRRFCIEIKDDMMFLCSRAPVATGSRNKWNQVLSDVTDLCAMIDSLPVWAVMRHKSKTYMENLPELREGIDEARVKKIILLTFGAFFVVLTVVVAWFHEW